MPTPIQYNAYAQTALAAYAPNLLADINNAAKYAAPDRMSASQATQFDATWNVLQQSAYNATAFLPYCCRTETLPRRCSQLLAQTHRALAT